MEPARPPWRTCGILYLTLLVLGISPVTGAAQDPIFSSQPVWISDTEGGYEKQLAFADIDHDGDLDLLVALGPQSHLFKNSGTREFFITDPAWVFPPGGTGYTIDEFSLGDVDQDGFVDALAGLGSLYLNHGSGFSLTPLWESQNIHRTFTLVDLDGDGRLDMACGGENDPDVEQPYIGYFLNNGGPFYFDAVPDWLTEIPAYPRITVAGDLDLDGDADLVIGNQGPNSGFPAPDYVFLNRGPGSPPGSLFGSDPDGILAASLLEDLGLGDVDGDGDLDLIVCENSTVRLLLNRHDEDGSWTAGIFDEAAAWSDSILTEFFLAITLGDVDGDGDLDLLVAASGEGESRLYLNQGPPTFFGDPSMFFPGIGERTTDIELADADNDGDLDLFTVQIAQLNGLRMHLNISPRLSLTADQPMLLPLPTSSLAVGDVDRDGDLDLAEGVDGGCYLFRMNPEGIPAIPPVGEAINQNATSTRDILLADFDSDGYPEIACANSNQENTVYDNNEGVFNSYPVWESFYSVKSTSLAAGDINGDGRPDLLVGNENAPNRLYRNWNGTLETQSFWAGEENQVTLAAVLVDLDVDGDLDAVFGNRNQANTVFLNEGSNLADSPVWWCNEEQNTTSAATGDVDGDGYPDLVFGNDGQPNTLYLNSFGSIANGFNTSPIWASSETDSTRSIDLVDLDMDGDLDIVCGNVDSGTAIYINSEGRFPNEASWRTDSTMDTRSVAFFDFDLDGDLDMVCGNRNQVNTVHNGLRNPLLPWDPTQPVHQLPNNPTLLSGLRVTGESDNQYRINLSVGDVESDPVGLMPRFRYADSPTWQPALIDPSFHQLATSPGGESFEFLWDVSSLPFDPRDVVFGIVTVPNPQSFTGIHQASSAQYQVGPLKVVRPQFEAEPVLSLPRVTWGDTVSALLAITNTGNAGLQVSSVDMPLPASRMWSSRSLPFTVEVGATVIDTVLLAPEPGSTIDQGILVVSNDPISPSVSITVEARISGLTAQTSPLLQGDTARLGEALTIQTIPPDTVQVERASLLYRSIGADTFLPIEMTESGRSFIGIIPGQDVTEAGLEFFVEVENSGFFGTDPQDTTGGHFFQLDVESPTGIDFLARPNSGSDFVANQSVHIDVLLPDGSNFVAGHLHYRVGGQGDFLSSPLTSSPPYMNAIIPDSVVDYRGVEFWVEVQTQTRTLTTPATSPGSNPHTIPVTVTNLIEPATFPGGRYRMVSVPLRFKDEFEGTLENLLFDQPEFGIYDPVQWRSYRWLPAEGRYVELSEEAFAPEFRPEPGRAFWLTSRNEHRITTAPITATSTPTDGPWRLELATGWNQVGNPFAFPVAWSSVQVQGNDPLETVVEPPLVWVHDSGYQSDVPILEPWQGYWVKNIADPPRTVILEVPARENSTAEVPSKSKDGWSLAIRASTMGAATTTSRLGCSSSAESGWDPNDRSEPPMNPGQALSVYFPHAGWGGRSGNYGADFRTPMNEGMDGYRWFFEVAGNFTNDKERAAVDLEFVDLRDVPVGYEVSLLDRELGRVQNLRERASYTFHLAQQEPAVNEDDARFVMLIGDGEYVEGQLADLSTPPLRTVLHQNYPNPFNPETVIRWDVAEPCEVDLKIYDLSGALVKTVHRGVVQSGGYEFVWRGDDDRGHRMASGVYFYRMKAGEVVQTKRMTLVK